MPLAGVSGRTLEKAAEVVEAARADPTLAPLVEEMDRTGRVSGVYRKLKTARSAERLRQEPPTPPDGPFRSPEQQAEVRERQRALARALRDQKKTQAEVAGILGVARRTVDEWESKGSNVKDDNACPPDRRFKLSPQDYEAIYVRAMAGEPHEQVAADFRISRRRVGQIVQLVAARQQEPEPIETPGFPKERYRCLPALAQGFDATSWAGP